MAIKISNDSLSTSNPKVVTNKWLWHTQQAGLIVERYLHIRRTKTTKNN